MPLAQFLDVGFLYRMLDVTRYCCS